ncbi:MAG: DUF6455 family protein [Woeseiaceae bacterium]|nr:DUF6455 family protein [Woeseiaceae bacterium]
MTVSIAEVLVGIGMLVVAIAIFLGFRKYLAVGSERRMRRMLIAVGLEADLATGDDMPRIMEEIRDRCRHCSSESVCERWLDGRTAGGNEFCPNHKVFEVLKKYTGAPAN